MVWRLRAWENIVGLANIVAIVDLLFSEIPLCFNDIFSL
jgi:hypothetical protein